MNFITLQGLQAFKEESEAQNNGAYGTHLTISQNAATGVNCEVRSKAKVLLFLRRERQEQEYHLHHIPHSC